jgi:glyoxylase-like metal-dependent hydrolase (beta-lactamase superfamily II)
MKRITLAVLGLLTIATLVVRFMFHGAPLPAPAPLTERALPEAAPPPGMAIARLATGITHRSAGFAYRGGSFSDERDFVMTATLVKHPRGDVLIDTGFGRAIDTQILLMPWFFRMTTSYERFAPAADRLDAAGYDRARLRGILLTHAHWDHASGLADFDGTPVLVTAEELRFVANGGWITAVARSAAHARWEEYAFDGGPYLGFSRSHDLYGDGSIVVVPSPGHTPGSVSVFVTLPTGKRYAFVGDLVWQREGIMLREERPWLQRSLADVDPAGVRAEILRMAAIVARFPEITVVPAHDARAFADVPPFE